MDTVTERSITAPFAELSDVLRGDLIVTGDKAMQKLGSFRGIPIVSAAQFVARLQQGHTGPPGPSGQTS